MQRPVAASVVDRDCVRGSIRRRGPVRPPGPARTGGPARARAALLPCLLAIGTALGLAACASGGSGGMGRATSRDLITAEDLAEVPADMTVFDLLRQHSSVRVQGSGGGQTIYVEDRTAWNMGAGPRWRAADLYVDERRQFDILGTLRLMSVSEVARLEILGSTDASARYGGGGRTPVIAITTKRG